MAICYTFACLILVGDLLGLRFVIVFDQAVGRDEEAGGAVV